MGCLGLPMALSIDLQPPINEYKYFTFTYLHLGHLCFNTHSLAILPFSSPEQRLITRTAFAFWVSPASLPCQVEVIVTSGAVRKCLFTVYHLHNLTAWLNELCHPEEVCSAQVKVSGSSRFGRIHHRQLKALCQRMPHCRFNSESGNPIFFLIESFTYPSSYFLLHLGHILFVFSQHISSKYPIHGSRSHSLFLSRSLSLSGSVPTSKAALICSWVITVFPGSLLTGTHVRNLDELP